MRRSKLVWPTILTNMRRGINRDIVMPMKP